MTWNQNPSVRDLLSPQPCFPSLLGAGKTGYSLNLNLTSPRGKGTLSNPECLLTPSRACSGYQNREQPPQETQVVGLSDRQNFCPRQEAGLPLIPRVNSSPALCFPGELDAASYFPREGLHPVPLAHKATAGFSGHSDARGAKAISVKLPQGKDTTQQT